MTKNVQKTKSDCILEFIPLSIYDGSFLFTCGFTHTEVIRILKKQKVSGWESAIRMKKEFFESSYMCAGVVTSTNPITKKEYDYVYIYLRDQFTFTDD